MNIVYNTICSHAGVMELADVPDSKSGGSDTVPVRPRSPAPESKLYGLLLFFDKLKKQTVILSRFASLFVLFL